MPAPLPVLLGIWAAVTVVFIGLVIWRSLISMREDDQLFLDPAESALENEQRALQARLNKITPYTKGFGFASAALLVAMAGVWAYHGYLSFRGY